MDWRLFGTYFTGIWNENTTFNSEPTEDQYSHLTETSKVMSVQNRGVCDFDKLTMNYNHNEFACCISPVLVL